VRPAPSESDSADTGAVATEPSATLGRQAGGFLRYRAQVVEREWQPRRTRQPNSRKPTGLTSLSSKRKQQRNSNPPAPEAETPQRDSHATPHPLVLVRCRKNRAATEKAHTIVVM
jgi:hypothetical protein